MIVAELSWQTADLARLLTFFLGGLVFSIALAEFREYIAAARRTQVERFTFMALTRFAIMVGIVYVQVDLTMRVLEDLPDLSFRVPVAVVFYLILGMGLLGLAIDDARARAGEVDRRTVG